MKVATNTCFYLTTIVCVLYLLSGSCKKDVLPELSTNCLTNITQISAACGGTIVSVGGSSVNQRGVCWSSDHTPTINDYKTLDGSGTGNYLSHVTGLTANTLYYVRAYAINNLGTVYGDLLFLKTYTGTISDVDENSYNTVTIGTQVWMDENLKTTRYNDGSAILNVSDSQVWTKLTSPAYCWYNNDEVTMKNLYGALYNWYSVNTYKLCPTGWHVPSNTDWKTLVENQGGDFVASGRLKEACAEHWKAPNTGVTNVSGFSSLPGGYLTYGFEANGNTGGWWSATEIDNLFSQSFFLYSGSSWVDIVSNFKFSGLSVRCLEGIVTLPSIPVLTTANVTNISSYNAISGGNITYDGGAFLSDKGICWSTSQNPTTANSKTSNGSGPGSFISDISGLSGNTTYYLRAYAITGLGTGYGDELNFTTLPPTFPVLTTINIALISPTDAISGGNIANDGGANVTARGVCWSTSQNPTTENNKTNDGFGTGIFASSITGLSGNTTYYVRAYATNSFGTSYGTQLMLSTPITSLPVTDYDGNVYNTVVIGSQVWMSGNLRTTKYSDGTPITLVNTKDNWAELVPSRKAYCYYLDDQNYANIYGAYYTWAAAMNGAASSSANPSGVQGVCPTGWHVPSDAEWSTLENYLGGSNIAGGKLKEAGLEHWNAPNIGATNETGFSGRPSGMRGNDGIFYEASTSGYWWSSSDNSYNYGSYLDLNTNGANTYSNWLDKWSGLSVRCVKN